LCSDTLGAVIVDQFLVPAQPYLNTVNIPITINKGSALGSAIQSIALYVVNDTGAITVSMSNIIAVKSTSSADNLSLTSMIGKNNDEYFLPILGIKNNLVILYNGNINDNNLLSLTNFYSGYYGTTETVNTYKIEPFYVLAIWEDAATINDSGTAGNYISFSGGWNRTDMSTQTSYTYFSGQGGIVNGIGVTSKNYIDISKINLSKYANGINFTTCTYCNLSDLCVSGNSSNGISLFASSNNNTIGKNKNGITNKVTIFFGYAALSNYQSHNNIIQDVFAASSSYGVGINDCINIYIENAIIKNCSIGLQLVYSILCANTILAEYCDASLSCSSDGDIVFLASANIKSLTANYTSENVIITSTSNIFIDNFIANGNTEAYLIGIRNNSIININSGTLGNIAPNSNYFIGCYNNDDGFVNFSNVTGIPASPTYFSNPYLLTFTNCTDTSSNILNYSTNVINYKSSKNTSVYHGTTGTSWKLEQLSTNVNQYFPIKFSVAKIAVNANKLTTLSLWFKNSASTITGKLVCPGYQLSGTDVVATTSTSTDWQKLTINFTPTSDKVIEIFAYAYGNQNDYLYVSDMSVTK
jgi:hypothetical protein